MVATYDREISTPKDEVRLLIGDRDTLNAQLSDEEITWFLSDEPNPLNAAINACDAIASSYGRQSDLTVGAVKMSNSQLQKSYEAIADRLRAKINALGIPPFVGGQSRSEKWSRRENADLVQPVFRRGLDSGPGPRSLVVEEFIEE